MSERALISAAVQFHDPADRLAGARPFCGTPADPHDRRVVRVHMTSSGEQLYQIGMEYNKQQIAHLLKDFSAIEQTQLLRLLDKLLDAFSAGQ
jgi:hypothetical protein